MPAAPRNTFDPDFVAALCHDLRGPLGAIGTWVHVLSSQQAPPETEARALAAMATDVRTLAGFIEQLAALGDSHAERPTERRPVDLVALLSSARSAAAADPELRLTASAAETEIIVTSDPVRLQKIFSWLGSRSLTGSAGERQVTVSRQGSFAEISVICADRIRAAAARVFEVEADAHSGEFERTRENGRDTVRLRLPLTTR